MGVAECHSAPVRTGEELAALERVDARVREMALAVGALEMQYPALVSRETLERAGYHESFPHLLMYAARSGDQLESERASESAGAITPTRWCLSPTVCHHVFGHLAGTVTDRIVITARGRCFRAEAETRPGIRQTEFEMREVVLLGNAAWVEACAERLTADLMRFGNESGVRGVWTAAEDPFFLPSGGSGRLLMQRLLRAKLEYQSPDYGGLALASVNRHRSLLTGRFNITSSRSEPLHSACVAVGLDRWTHQVLSKPIPAQEICP